MRRWWWLWGEIGGRWWRSISIPFLHGIQIARLCPPVSHLMFASSCVGEPSKDFLLKEICGLVGTSYKFWKKMKTIQRVLNMRLLEKGERYLGNPLFLSQNRSKDFEFLKTKVQNRLESWKSKLLSQASRTTLVSLVLQGIAVYSLTTFRVLKTVYCVWRYRWFDETLLVGGQHREKIFPCSYKLGWDM